MAASSPLDNTHMASVLLQVLPPWDTVGGHAPRPCWGQLQAPFCLESGSPSPCVLLQMLLPFNVPLVGMHLGYVIISWLGLLPWSRDRLAAFAHVADILFAMVVQMVLAPSVSQLICGAGLQWCLTCPGDPVCMLLAARGRGLPARLCML